MTINWKLSPRLVVHDAAGAIDFYVRTLGAKEVQRFDDGAGKIVHAELTLGDHTITVKDEDDTDPASRTLGGTPVIMWLAVDDLDAAGARMTEAGAAVVFPIDNRPDAGGRMGRLRDPYGHLWILSQLP